MPKGVERGVVRSPDTRGERFSDLRIVSRNDVTIRDCNEWGGTPNRPELFRPADILTKNEYVRRSGYIEDSDTIRSWGRDYQEMAQRPLTVVSLREGNDTNPNQQFMVIGPKFTAEDTAKLFYFVAPDKDYTGLNLDDLLRDWGKLFEQTWEKKRLAGHKGMPGFDIFEANKDAVWALLKKNTYSHPSNRENRNHGLRLDRYSFVDVEDDDYLIPTLVWGNDGAKREINLSSLSDETLAKIGELTGTDASKFNTMLGACWLAAFSPDQSRWGKESGYKYRTREEEEADKTFIFGRRNDMNTTQAPQLVIRNIVQAQTTGDVPDSENLTLSPLLPGWEDTIKWKWEDEQ